jgi:hypothetical protein
VLKKPALPLETSSGWVSAKALADPMDRHTARARLESFMDDS